MKRLQFTTVISTTRLDLESELANMRILDDNPQKPVVRMANLCVVSSHAVSVLFRTQRRVSSILPCACFLSPYTSKVFQYWFRKENIELNVFGQLMSNSSYSAILASIFPACCIILLKIYWLSRQEQLQFNTVMHESIVFPNSLIVIIVVLE